LFYHFTNPSRIQLFFNTAAIKAALAAQKKKDVKKD